MNTRRRTPQKAVEPGDESPPIVYVEPDPNYVPGANAELERIVAAHQSAMKEWNGRDPIPGDPWDSLRWRIRYAGDTPTKEELLYAMRRAGVPKDLGAYVADRIEKKRGRGRPPKSKAEVRDDQTADLALAQRVRLRQAALRIAKVKGPRETARHQIAREEHMALDTLKGKVESLGREARRLVPSLAMAEKALRGHIQTGALRITDKGIVEWLLM